jgi:hypothetical protein
MTMKQQVIEAGGGQDYDWANDHICVKTTCDHADGRITMVEDTLKPGFRLACHYHKKMTAMSEAQYADGTLMQSLAEQYDTWMV